MAFAFLKVSYSVATIMPQGCLTLITHYLVKADKTLQLIYKANSLNPDFTWDYLFNPGVSHYPLQQHDKAIDLLLQTLGRNENTRLP